MLILVGLHVAGAAFASLRHGKNLIRNLIRARVSGRFGLNPTVALADVLFFTTLLLVDDDRRYHVCAGCGTLLHRVPNPTFSNKSINRLCFVWSATGLEHVNMKFRPLHDRVVVKRADNETKTSGGIIIPDTAGEKPQLGKVIAVGPGTRDEAGKFVPVDVKNGDKVLFGKWSGTEVKIDGEELLIMKESDVMGVLDT